MERIDQGGLAEALRSGRRFAWILYFSAQEEWRRRWNLLGRLLFFSVILLGWSHIWRVGAAKLAANGTAPLSANDFTWYIAVTELVVLSIAYAHVGIEQDIRSGDFATFRSRPMSFISMQLAKYLGSSFMQFICLASVGTLVAFAYSGTFPWPNLPLIERLAFGVTTILLALLGLAIASTCYVIFGMCSVWVEEVSPLVWLFQKMMFLLGGLVVPLSLYPNLLRSIAEFTPFSSMMGEPASLVFQPSWVAVTWVSLKLFFWLALSFWSASFVHTRALRTTDIQG